MDSPQRTGAEAPPRADDPALQSVVTGLLRLSSAEQTSIDSYDISTCDDLLWELVDYANNPAGKPERSIPKVVGQIFLINQRRAKLQLAEQSRIQAQSHEEMTQLQEEVGTLREQLQATQRREARPSVSITANQDDQDLASLPERSRQVSPVPNPTELDENTQLRLELRAMKERAENLERQLRAPQTVEPAALVVLDSYQAPPPAHTSGMTTPGALDTYRTLPSARLVDTGAPPSGGAPQSTLSRPSLLLDRGRGGYSEARNDTSDFGPHPACEPYASQSSRPRADWSSPPPSRRRERPHHQDEMSDYGASDDDSWAHQRSGLRTRQLESLARDIERFDPSSRDSNIDDYLREIERCLIDLPHASSREKLKLLWKTTARSVHVFMETLPSDTRDHYPALRRALREEYAPYSDETSATLGALTITQKRNEPPREYYRRLRAAYFQGRNAPGLEEDRSFKSLYLHNLHECVRYDVTMHCRTGNPTMQEIKRYAQVSWETRVRPSRGHEGDARVLGIQASDHADLSLEGNEMPRGKADNRARPQGRRPPRQQGGQRNQGNGNQLHPQHHGKPRWQNHSQEKGKVHFERNSKQGYHENQWKGKSETSHRESSNQDIEDMVRRCVSEAMRQRDASPRPPGPPESPAKPGNAPPSA